MGIYLATIRITAIILIITSADVISNSMISNRRRWLTVITCICIGLAAGGEAVGVITEGGESFLITVHKAAKLVEFCFAPALGVTAALSYGDAVKPKLAVAIVIAHGVFQIVALRFGLVFTVDQNNVYHRESMYWIYVLAFIATLFYGFWGVFRRERRYQAVGHKLVLICNFCFLVIGVGIQFVFSGIRIDYICIALANIFLSIGYFRTDLMVDSLTLLLNRRCYEANLEKMGDRAVIIYFDIDNFKMVNDEYGHSAGDRCLRKTADLLQKIYGDYGSCYRLGGDEFCVILSDEIEKREQLEREFQTELAQLREADCEMPDISIGYGVYDAVHSHVQQVIEEADAMLYMNKARNADAAKEVRND